MRSSTSDPYIIFGNPFAEKRVRLLHSSFFFPSFIRAHPGLPRTRIPRDSTHGPGQPSSFLLVHAIALWTTRVPVARDAVVVSDTDTSIMKTLQLLIPLLPLAAAIQPSAQNPVPGQRFRHLKWGPINFLHTSDKFVSNSHPEAP